VDGLPQTRRCYGLSRGDLQACIELNLGSAPGVYKMSFTDMTNWVVWSPQDKASGGLELHVLEGRRIAIREEAPIRLSSRQSQVLSLIVDGLTDAEAAEQLGISPRTVRMHADVLRVKLGVSRRRQLPLAYRRMRSLGRIELTLDGRPAE